MDAARERSCSSWAASSRPPANGTSNASLDWRLAEDPPRRGVARLLETLGHLYREHPCLWRGDPDPDGFVWIDCHDRVQSIVSYLRRDGADELLVVLNATPTPHPDYRIGAPRGGAWRLRFSSDAQAFGGSGFAASERAVVESRPASRLRAVDPTRAPAARRPRLRARALVTRRPELRALALRAGIIPAYVSLVDRRPRLTSDATREALLAAMSLDASSERSAAAARRALDERLRSLPRSEELAGPAPRCTPVASKLARGRGFGIWTNLYTLRSARNFGAGDLSDLARLAQIAGREGADFIGISPLHALWNRGPHVSPYSPISRLYRSELYLDVLRVPELASSARGPRAARAAGLRARARAAARFAARRVRARRRGEARDPARVAPRLRGAADGVRARAYQTYREREGQALDDFATFLALGEQRRRAGRAGPRLARAGRARCAIRARPRVAAFRREHAREVDFHRFVQFELDRQLGAAAAAAKRAGMAIGLYPDLALGSAGGGAETWACPELFAQGASLGAPPDAFSPQGQNWAIPPLDPLRLREQGFAFFRQLLRAAFAHAGALRIDHVLGVFRLYWIPRGRPASEGAYVRQPARELLAILAQESARQGALVVGEDLGSVPPGTQARLASHGILSSRVLYFERAGRRLPPGARLVAPRARDREHARSGAARGLRRRPRSAAAPPRGRDRERERATGGARRTRGERAGPAATARRRGSAARRAAGRGCARRGRCGLSRAHPLPARRALAR